MSDQTMHELLTDVSARMTALGEQVSTERLIQLVQNQFALLIAEQEPFTRKMRFGADAKLIGSKYARWGLGIADIEWLYDILIEAQRSGRSTGPSETLSKAFNELS